MPTKSLDKICLIVLIAAVPLAMAGTAPASTTGRLSGRVVDEEGVPLPGVAVSASSPTQIGGVQLTETDAEGWFQYPRLNPGYFTVRLKLEGFLTQELTEVQVRLDRMTQMQVTLTLGAFADQMKVTETTPVVDPQQVSLGQTFTDDFMERATIGLNTRNMYFQTVLRAAGTASVNPGSETDNAWYISVLGSTSAENIFQIDGLDTSDPYWGGPRFLIPMDSIHELSFDAGGFGAESGGGTGGVINALTKSGGNDFFGTFDARYRDNSLETSGEHYDPDEQTSSNRIVGATLGGRLIRNRAWFFGALESQVWEWTSEPPTTTKQTSELGFVKVTSQVAPDWLVLGKLQWGPLEALNQDARRERAPEATARWTEDRSILQAEVSGVLAPNLLWELQIGSQLVEDDWGPMSGDTSAISHYNLVTGTSTGNTEQVYYQDKGRDQVRTQLSWFVEDALGGHDIELGADYQRTFLDEESCATGIAGGGFCQAGREGLQFLDLTDDLGAAFPYVLSSYIPPGAHEMEGGLASLYAADSWRVRPDITLRLGLRWDRTTYENDLGQEVVDFSMLQPRLGVTWNLTRNGRNLLRASWGRYMHSSFLYLPRLALSKADRRDTWLSCSLPEAYGGLGLTDPADCAAAARSLGLHYRTDPEGWDPAGWLLLNSFRAASAQIAPDLEPISAETWVVGYERELLRRTSLELSYVDKATGGIYEDTCIGNYPNPGAGADCSSFIVANIPGARRDYSAWILNFESRALDRFHVLASYTNSDTKSSTSQGFIDTPSYDVYPYHFQNRYGYAWHHRKHRIKASGYLDLPLDFGLGFNGVWGAPFRWTPTQEAALVDPSLWGDIYLEPRGSREGDEWAQLDVQATKGFNIGRVRLQLIGTVINLFDAESAFWVCMQVTGCGDTELGEATYWQQPRRYELGVRVEF